MNIDKLTNFTKLTFTQKKMVLSWRNHENVRKWMINSEPISLSEHLSFIESLESSDTKQYFLVGNYGVIYFTNITTGEAEFGIYTNPDMRGVGNLLMQELVNYGLYTLRLSKLVANVFPDNEKAISLYKRFNFVKKIETIFNGKKIVMMELLRS